MWDSSDKCVVCSAEKNLGTALSPGCKALRERAVTLCSLWPPAVAGDGWIAPLWPVRHRQDWWDTGQLHLWWSQQLCKTVWVISLPSHPSCSLCCQWCFQGNEVGINTLEKKHFLSKALSEFPEMHIISQRAFFEKKRQMFIRARWVVWWRSWEHLCEQKGVSLLFSVPGALWPVKICSSLKRGVSLNLSLDVCSAGVRSAPIVWAFWKLKEIGTSSFFSWGQYRNAWSKSCM